MKLVDIIIPVYKNAEETLSKALASIMFQSELDKVKVTVVDDASGELDTYTKLIEKFNALPGMDISLISVSENCGPGLCRQVGINATSLPYIMFVDSDDQLASKYSVQFLLAAIHHNPFHIVLSDFTEEIHHQQPLANGALQVYEHKKDMTWMFAKIYRRQSLIDKAVCFNPKKEASYANEDSGFNTLFRLLTPEENIGYVDFKTYIWSGRADSITRSNNREYSFNKGFIGFVENQIYALGRAMASPLLVKEKLTNQIMVTFLTCYKTVAECYCSPQHKADFLRQCVFHARKYYTAFSSYIIPMLTEGPKIMDVIMKLVPGHVAQQYTFFEFIRVIDPSIDVIEIRQKHLESIG